LRDWQNKMSLLIKLGIGEEPKEIVRPSFEELVNTSINPKNARANQLATTVRKEAEKLDQRYSFKYSFAIALAYLGIGRSHDALVTLKEVGEFLPDLYVWDPFECPLKFVPVVASYAVLGKAEIAEQIMEKWNRITPKRWHYSPEFSLAYLAVNDYEKASEMIRSTLQAKDNLQPHYFDWRRSMLIEGRSGTIRFDPYLNAAFAISLFCLGEKDIAKKVVRGLESLDFDLESGLICYRWHKDNINTSDIAATALLSFAHSLIDEKEEELPRLQEGPKHPYRGLPQNV